MNVARGAVIALLHGYRLAISPLLPRACRFVPTCSQYALDAVTKHGVLTGSRYAASRILRCHPWHPGGFDPVPSVRRKGSPPWHR